MRRILSMSAQRGELSAKQTITAKKIIYELNKGSVQVNFQQWSIQLPWAIMGTLSIIDDRSLIRKNYRWPIKTDNQNQLFKPPNIDNDNPIDNKTIIYSFSPLFLGKISFLFSPLFFFFWSKSSLFVPTWIFRLWVRYQLITITQ